MLDSESFPPQLIADMKKSMKPSTKEILYTHNMKWGEKSTDYDHKFTMVSQIHPVFKDNECYEQTMFGCKDKYGVVYPIWYNMTHNVMFENTDLPITVMKNMQVSSRRPLLPRF